jgi:polyhydroxyalkanoate synthesis regulator phasin
MGPEIAAAIVGAVLTFAGIGVTGVTKRATEGREAVIRLTLAVESVSSRLEQLHVDLKSDRAETYSRLNSLEQRVSKLEARESL